MHRKTMAYGDKDTWWTILHKDRWAQDVAFLLQTPSVQHVSGAKKNIGAAAFQYPAEQLPLCQDRGLQAVWTVNPARKGMP